jgi:hypothetical protein
MKSKIKVPKISFLSLLSLLLLFSCTKKVNEEVYEIKTQGDKLNVWLSKQNSNFVKNETIVIKKSDGSIVNLKPQWAEATKRIKDGIEYTEVPFSFTNSFGKVRRLLTDSSININPCIFTLQFWHNTKTLETKVWVAENFINSTSPNNGLAAGSNPTIISLIHNLNGDFVTGYEYDKGKRVKKISREGSSGNLVSGRTNECTSITYTSYATQCSVSTSSTGGYNSTCWSVAIINYFTFCSYGNNSNSQEWQDHFGPGDGGDGGNGDPNAAFDQNTIFEILSGPAIDLQNHFNCFEQVPDAGASYSVSISTDIPNNSNPNIVAVNSNVGHTFLTLTKSNMGQKVTKSFGFYPKNGLASVLWGYVDNKIVNDGGHVFDASYTLSNISSLDFNSVMFLSKNLASNRDYSLNNFNCTDYALSVINFIKPQPLNVPDHISPGKNWGTTPGALYKVLQQLSLTDPNASLNFGTSASASAPCP